MDIPEHSTYDVIIIGAGLSGLSAGIRLSQFFKRILIVESHSIAGGLNSYYEHGRPTKHLFSSGLHTVTNARVTGRKWGLGLISRNLGIKPEEFSLYEPDASSRITSGDLSVEFSNDRDLLRSEIQRLFPSSVDEFSRFEAAIVARSGDLKAAGLSARDFLSEQIRSPQLADILALPVFTYAGYREQDIDLRTFSLLYRSIFMDGCGSPVNMKEFLARLIDRFRCNGGEICFKCNVRKILHHNGEVAGIATDGGELASRYVLSSAGLHETGQLAGLSIGDPGSISLFHVTACYDRKLSGIGIPETLHFWNRRDDLEWRFDSEEQVLSVLTLSAQDAYTFDSGRHQLKISCFDKMENWQYDSKREYRQRKQLRAEKLFRLAGRLYPSLLSEKPVYVDTFSPRTIRRFTQHPNGTLYGGTVKAFDGRTPLKNLLIIGNDQGGIGIMGALTSGILISNYAVLVNA